MALLSNITGLLLALGFTVLVARPWSATALTWGAVGGAFGLVGLLLLYTGLATGPNRLVSPVAAVVSAVVPVVAGLGLGERPGPPAMVGLALTPIAVWAVAGGRWSAAESDRRSLVIALGAGMGFGLFFVCLAQTPDDAGALPLVAARATSVTILIVALALGNHGRTRSGAGGGLSLAVVAGSLDMTANGLFLWASREGDLAIVGALVSLFPATTVALAVAFLHERLERRQAAGIALGLAAAALLS